MDDAPTPELLARHVGATRVLRAYRVFPELGSTNTYLREETRDEAEGLVVVAEYQTAGRGRQGRAWVAPRGAAIHCSVLLRPPLPAADRFLLTAACALAVRDALTPVVGEPPALKWPNDVLLGGRKVCGVLAEAQLAPGAPPRVVVGFGVNVHAAPPLDLAPSATWVAAHATKSVTRAGILAAALASYDALLSRLYDGGAEDVWGEWRRALRTLGREVEVRRVDGSTPLRGFALDVARDGALLLATEPGAPPLAVYAGDAIERSA